MLTSFLAFPWSQDVEHCEGLGLSIHGIGLGDGGGGAAPGTSDPRTQATL